MKTQQSMALYIVVNTSTLIGHWPADNAELMQGNKTRKVKKFTITYTDITISQLIEVPLNTKKGIERKFSRMRRASTLTHEAVQRTDHWPTNIGEGDVSGLDWSNNQSFLWIEQKE
jgi:hypothetical protein